MSSQDKGIPLHNIPDDAGYRLIELPPEVEALLEADNATALTLESGDNAGLLRTPGKTYALRQKNTSNALILLKPHTSRASSPTQGLATFATIHDTVELELVKDPASDPEPRVAPAKGKWHERFGRNR
ncbi:Uncharacterized conserved protein (DUF2036) [Geosmithia morbida]|uniref:Uncharacterized conserved protein (DUF2036) n=1 Tax=Geosmithia morbida TaxID=1094350 RepID=A0A9P4Z1N2_9HYPO|nr:Uncharacterized conserved protein (DUF2036) [Geosmithia morbida]KAF4126492.1 Uncharacterized conserved protein (DUF2036) [Geosmithia morbida]